MAEVAITGMGVISSLGVGRDAFWEGVRTGRSGIKKITRFDTAAFRSNIAGWIDDFHPERFMPPRSYRRLSHLSRMAVVAAVEAVGDSGIDFDKRDRERVAVIMGTAYGSSSMVDEFFKGRLREGPRGAHPFYFPETVPNAPASHIAIFLGITGPNTTFCQNELSAESAIMYARNLLLQDRADVVLVGGADEISEMQYSCYDAVLALNRVRATEGDTIRPVPGGGLVLGEGAGILVMERGDDARRRGARIYGYLKSGIVTGGIAAINRYESTGEQAARAVRQAMEAGGVTLGEIDQIDCSANCSHELDGMEAAMLRTVFKSRRESLMVSPLKYRMGDFGGAGAVRAVAILLSMYYQAPLPSTTLDSIDGGVPADFQWHMDISEAVKVSLMTTSTFGGASSGMIFTAAGG